MEFTEHEMTAGVQAAARQLFADMPKLVRRRMGGVDWHGLTRLQQFKHVSAAGERVLPGLLALPERPIVGARPEFTCEEYLAAAEEACRSRADAGEAGRWERVPARRRRKLVEATADQLQVAVAAMPVRPDPDRPDELVVPDHL